MSKFVDVIVTRTETREIVVLVDEENLTEEYVETQAIEQAKNLNFNDFKLVNVDYDALPLA